MGCHIVNFKKNAPLQRVQKKLRPKKWKINLALDVENRINLNGCVAITCIILFIITVIVINSFIGIIVRILSLMIQRWQINKMQSEMADFGPVPPSGKLDET